MACLSGPMLGIGLTGCTVGPDYQSPEMKEATRRSALNGGSVPSRTVEGAVNIVWWKSFRDFQLSSLVERLVAQNLDLETAAERVIQSMAQRRVAASQGLPHIEGQSSATYNRQSPNGVALAAVAELAQSYMQLRGTQSRLGIAKRNLRLAEENVELVNTRFGNGVATTLDVAQARAQQATIAATLPPLRTQEAELINAIGLLLGDAPRALEAELRRSQILPRVPRKVPVGLPGTLVRRRPDVREAEARLHEATAQTGVAVASFYPDVTLNGAANLESLHLSHLTSLTSAAFALGPSISIPIFEGGRLSGALALSESRQREAAISFQKTVLRAWKEVDDALTAYREAQRSVPILPGPSLKIRPLCEPLGNVTRRVRSTS